MTEQDRISDYLAELVRSNKIDCISINVEQMASGIAALTELQEELKRKAGEISHNSRKDYSELVYLLKNAVRTFDTVEMLDAAADAIEELSGEIAGFTEDDKLRDALIEAIGLHTGWEESAVEIVDVCIIPALKAANAALFRADVGYLLSTLSEKDKLLEMAAEALSQVEDILKNNTLIESDKGWRINAIIAPVKSTLRQHLGKE